MMPWPSHIWVIGCGNMGGAILQAWLDNGAPIENISVVKPNKTELPGGLISQSKYPQGEAPDLVLLAMKPYQLSEVASKLAPLVDDNTRIVSILAGTEIDVLRQNFAKAGAIIRLMPNMAVTVGKSPMIFFGEHDNIDLRQQMDRLFSTLGQPEWLETEAQMHIATALSGSGPAFLFRFIDALIAGATDLGMAKEQAERLAVGMVDGAATLAAISDLDPGSLANQVAGRGGTTHKGLEIMDADGRVNGLLHAVLKAAMERNMEMAEEAKQSSYLSPVPASDQ